MRTYLTYLVKYGHRRNPDPVNEGIIHLRILKEFWFIIHGNASQSVYDWTYPSLVLKNFLAIILMYNNWD